MSLFSFFKKNEIENKVNAEIVPNESNIEQDDEITAVISAVLASMDDEETVAAITVAIACMLGRNINDFIVRSIKKSPEIESLWASVGRMNLMR